MEQIAITAQHIDDPHSPLQYCLFDENGGTIGNDNTNSFCLEDSSLQAQHVNIQYEEGCFTIANINDSAIFYNNSFSKLHSGYETTMELGDIFKAGSYKFSVIDPRDIQEDFIDNKKIINEVAPYNKLDSLDIKPRGQINGMNLHEEKIEDIFTKDHNINDLLHITPLQESLSILDNTQTHDTAYSQHQNTDKNTDIHKEAYPQKERMQIAHSTLQYIKTFLHNTLDAHTITPLHLDDIITQTKNISLESEALHSLTNDTLLINATPIINSVILALITKELQNNFCDAFDNNPYMLALDYALYQSTQGDNKPLETLLLKALESYIKSTR